ncbi:helix-turn-helix domain-containing protein [Burkholderia ubonensis]|uniref:helix-turn-helix domain-containing protein n=1 Tax=Burkholderia ubonensis TaxID=101571 RepID=UPI0012F8A938|nr:helix-turn-helix domain-containing protein [Burkholderia ubonensis]
MLTEVERLTLGQLSVNHRHRDIRTRAAVLLLMSGGLSAPKAAERLGVSVQSPYNWVRAWRVDGIAGLLGGHGGGRPRSLSEAMVTTAIQAARTVKPTTRERLLARSCPLFVPRRSARRAANPDRQTTIGANISAFLGFADSQKQE